MRRRFNRLPVEVRREVMRLAGQGLTYREIQELVDVSAGTVANVLVPLGGVIRQESLVRSGARLSAEDRVEIRLGLERRESYRQIGARIGRAASTVCREVNRHGGRDGYRPLAAHEQAWTDARRPKASKLWSNPELCDRVVGDLRRLYSPQQIARRLKFEFGDDPDMNISHETIYRSIYVQGRGELRRELARCLRTGRAKRRPQGRAARGAGISGMVMISERPAEAADRAVPGHWEGDLILGKDGKSQIGTLVERSTRYLLLLHLPEGRTAEQVRNAMAAKIAILPQHLRRSLTWDQGSEMAQHHEFTVQTGLPVYFCDPHSPWQRGSNENTNGLLRQYFPKGTDLSVHDEAVLDAAAHGLNDRPRETLGWMKPAEKLAELVALTG